MAQQTSQKRGCTQCGECLNVCPVYKEHKREEFSPKAKRLLLEPLEKGASTLDWKEVAELARLCTGCGKCQQACARKLSTAELLANVRAQNPHWTQHMWEMWISHMGPLWPALGYLANLVPDALVPGKLETSLATARAMTAPQQIEPWVRLTKKSDHLLAPRSVVLFGGCTATNIRPQWIEKATALLSAWGYRITNNTGFGCCGNTLHHAGELKGMHKAQQKNIRWWKDQGKPLIATFCASCYHGLTDYEEQELFSASDVVEWKKAIHPLSALLTGIEATVLPGKPEKYGYHHPCHWGTNTADKTFLASILPGMAVSGTQCCGMGGILKMTDPDLSAQIAQRCLESFPADISHILTGCSGCAMQLKAYAKPETTIYHWLDIVTKP